MILLNSLLFQGLLLALLTFVSIHLKAQDKIEVTLAIQQAPKLQANAGEDIIINGSSQITLGGNPVAQGGTPPYSYQWSPTTGLSNSQVEKPSLNVGQGFIGIYTVSVTDSNDCSAQDEINIEVITNIEGAIEGLPFYPNPATDFVIINPAFPVDKLKIVSPDGKLLVNTIISATYHRIDLHNFQSGIYTLQLESQGVAVSYKLIIVK